MFKLRTYRINQKRGKLDQKLSFFRNLYLNNLKRDKFWHFFLDPEGGTLRFQPRFEGKVERWLKKNAKDEGFTFKKRLLYSPERHEYYKISFLKDEILPLFHDLSILSVNYPPEVAKAPILERLNHVFVNQLGIHDFVVEATIYLRMAEARARLVKGRLPLPTWLYKLYFKAKKYF